MNCLNCRVGVMAVPQDGHPSYLICRNCNSIQLQYLPLDYQEDLHKVPYVPDKDGGIRPQILGIFGGYGSGKSRASLSELFVRCLENPNGTTLITAPTLSLLKRTTIKTLLGEIIPPLLIEYFNKSDMEIKLINGHVIYAIASDDDEKLRSINAGLIHMEEASAIKRSIFDQLLSRMRDPFVKNKAIFVCSNPEQTWIKDVLVDNDKRKNPNHPEHADYNPYITNFIWATKLNKFLPPDFIEINSRGKPSWFIRKYLEGSFEAAEGAVYPRMSECIVDPFEIPKHWEHFVGMDHGLRNPTAAVFGAIDPDKGIVYIYDEYYVPNRLVPDHAKYLKPMIDKIPTGRLRFLVIDPSAKNKTDPVNGKSVQHLYQEYGMFFQPGNNAIEAGILRVNSYIERGKLKFFANCINTIREHLGYKFPEITMDNDKNLDEKPEKKNEHSCFVAGTLIETDKGLMEIERVTMGDRVLTRQGYKRVIDWAVTDLNTQTYTVEFSNGSSIVATGNHPVWVEEKGFLPIDELRYGDIIKVSSNWERLSCQNQKSLCTTDIGTEDTQNQKIYQTKSTTSAHTIMEQKQNTYIDEYMKTTSDPYQKATMSIIKMETQATTRLTTWKQFLRSITYLITQKKENTIPNTWNESDRLRLHGIVQKKGETGTANMQRAYLETYLNKSLYVKNAVKRLVRNLLERLSFAVIIANPIGAGSLELTTKYEYAQNAKKNFGSTNMRKEKPVQENVVQVVSVKLNLKREAVFNITVEDAHEYYANGVLVSNCDALRYALMKLPENPDDLTNLSYSPPKRYARIIGDANEYGWDDSGKYEDNMEDWRSYT